MKRTKVLAKHPIGKSLQYYRNKESRALIKKFASKRLSEKEIIGKVWAKGKAVENNDPDKYRKDECGAWIYFSHYSNRDSQYGWEIDHINLIEDDPLENLNNLRPLQWQNFVCKGSGELACIVTSNKTSNGPNKNSH
tara:strand:- start:16949 stop:17359 length:411 start_codon:yes stop_codon:yes gene_type:complete